MRWALLFLAIVNLLVFLLAPAFGKAAESVGDLRARDVVRRATDASVMTLDAQGHFQDKEGRTIYGGDLPGIIAREAILPTRKLLGNFALLFVLQGLILVVFAIYEFSERNAPAPGASAKGN